MDDQPPKLISPFVSLEARTGFPPDFYWILKSPFKLAGCSFPFKFDQWQLLHEEGFRHIFCVASEVPRYCPSPLTMAVACDLDDLSFRELPLDPQSEALKITRIAEIVVSRLKEGEGCVVHCAAGRGRTGSVIGVVLRMLGFPADAIIGHLDAIHQHRNGRGWPESPWQARLVADTRIVPSL